MSGHRYWRVINPITFGSGDVLNAMEGRILRLVNAEGVITNNPSKTISSGGYGGQYDPIGAFDDSKNFAAKPDAKGDRWIGYDFGASVNVDVNAISVSMHADAGFERNWKSVTVEHSDDAVSWVFSGVAIFNIVGLDKAIHTSSIVSNSSLQAFYQPLTVFLNIYTADESGSISGQVQEKGVPIKAEVVLHDRLTRKTLAITWSDNSGNYSFNGLDKNREYYAEALHPTRKFNLVGQDGIRSGMTT